jgi:hypothetical protein
MPTSRKSLTAPFAGGPIVEVEMGLDGLDQLLAHGEERVEAGQRVLEDGADLAPADPSDLLVGQVVDALALEPDRAAGDAARRVEEPDDRHAGERLAGPRFADHAQDLARPDRERHVVDGDQPAAAGRETRS